MVFLYFYVVKYLKFIYEKIIDFKSKEVANLTLELQICNEKIHTNANAIRLNIVWNASVCE